MTTLVATRQALKPLSMGNQPGRRTSKRLAAAVEYENDDDFQFVRKSKKAKTDNPEPAKKPARGRPAKERVIKEPVAIPEEEEEQQPQPQQQSSPSPPRKATTKRSTRRKPSVDPEPQDDAPSEVKPTARGKRKGAQLPVEEGDDVLGEVPTNGASQGRARTKAGSSRGAKLSRESPPQQETSVESAKITLPMSDTPIINRNKEMRKKGNGNRRSSLGTRGRRASSLIDSGQTAIPHKEVNPADFYKHIEAEGLTEPRRMKQLLTWCGERALSEKPRHGSKNAGVIHGARAIQDQLLKDFASRSEFSDWFSRDDAPKAPVILKPNPRNMELDEKVAQLEENIKRLQEEKRAWQAIRKPPPEVPPLSTEQETEHIVLPDFDLLDADDGKIRGFLADEGASLDALRSKTEKRLQSIRSSLEFEIDQLADSVHKLEQRVSVADEEADRVLTLSALRLKEREQRERTEAGTKDMPIMEILRSLGGILPEGGG